MRCAIVCETALVPMPTKYDECSDAATTDASTLNGLRRRAASHATRTLLVGGAPGLMLDVLHSTGGAATKRRMQGDEKNEANVRLSLASR